MSCSGGGGMRRFLAGGSIDLANGRYGVAAIRTLAEALPKAGQVLVVAGAGRGARTLPLGDSSESLPPVRRSP